MKLFNIQRLSSCPHRCLFFLLNNIVYWYIKGVRCLVTSGSSCPLIPSVGSAIDFGNATGMQIAKSRLLYICTRSFSFFPFPFCLCPSFERGKKFDEGKPDEILHLTFVFISREIFYVIIPNRRYIS